MAVGTRRRDSVQGAFELGPRSMALLRRLVFLMEQAFNEGVSVPDPGKDTEDEDVTWPTAGE